MTQLTKNELRTKALLLHRGGFGVTRIAEACKVSRSTVYRWIKTELKQRLEREAFDVAEWRAIQIERYEYILSQLISDVKSPKTANAAIAALARLDKLLGTEQPTASRIDSTVNSTVEDVTRREPALAPDFAPMTDEQFLALYEGLGYDKKK